MAKQNAKPVNIVKLNQRNIIYLQVVSFLLIRIKRTELRFSRWQLDGTSNYLYTN